MAYCQTPELNDVHRLLPPEIFADIGIADAETSPAANVVRSLVEHLAVHLANVVAGCITKTVAPSSLPNPPATTRSSSSCQHPLVGGNDLLLRRGFDRSAAVANNCHNGRRVVSRPDWPFLPTAVAPDFPARRYAPGGAALLPRFVPPCRPRGRGPPPTTQRCGGTGVFLPRVEAYETKTRRDGADVKPARTTLRDTQRRSRGDREAMATTKQPALLHAPVSGVERQEEDAAAAALRACPERALPLEWTY